jgi:hypothetical protein
MIVEALESHLWTRVRLPASPPKSIWRGIFDLRLQIFLRTPTEVGLSQKFFASAKSPPAKYFLVFWGCGWGIFDLRLRIFLKTPTGVGLSQKFFASAKYPPAN